MSLSFDTARCKAHKPYGIPAVPCRDCQRKFWKRYAVLGTHLLKPNSATGLILLVPRQPKEKSHDYHN